MFTDIVTVFNRKASRSGDTYYATVITGVQLDLGRSSVIKEYGAECQDNALMSVRYRKENDSVIIGGKKWLTPKMWAAADDPGNCLTFKGGVDFDFFWVGEWTGDNIINSADYTGGFFEYMNTSCDNVFAISSVGGPFGAIPHFEVTGK